LKIARRLLVLGLALMTALALVAPAFAQGTGQAQVRVAHLAPDAPNVDVYVNGDPVLTDVPYTTVSDYLSLPAGTQQVTVYATGDTTSPVIDTPVELAAGGAYTVAAVGLVADDSLTAQVYQDDLRSPASGNAKVRVVHASPDAGPVDVVPRGGDPLVSGLAFPDASPYAAEVPAGTYTLDVNAAGTNKTALTVPDATLASGGVYSAFAVGTVFADSLNVLLVQDNAGTSASASATASASAAASSTASPSASATSNASMEKLPESGGVGTWVALSAALALMGCGIGAIALVRRSVT
jgi:hypothetical protein